MCLGWVFFDCTPGRVLCRLVAVLGDAAYEGEAGEGGAAADLFAVAAEDDSSIAHAVGACDGIVHEPHRFLCRAPGWTRDTRERERQVRVESEPRALGHCPCDLR